MAKVLVSIPDDLLARVDRAARDGGQTRSDFLATAARQALGWPSAARMKTLLTDARSALATAGAFESGDLIAATRRERDDDDRRRL